MTEKWMIAVDNRGVFAVLLADLSKVFKCIPHDLIIAKLVAYGFDTNGLKLIHNYLSNRKQSVEVNSTFKHMERCILWYSTRFHTWTLRSQYTLM